MWTRFQSLHPDRRHELTFAVVLFLAVALGALACEFAARWYYGLNLRQDFQWHLFTAATTDPDDDATLKTFLPNSRYQHIEFNNLGFRGPDLTEQKPPGVIRIAFLGDSKLLSAMLGEDDMIANRATDVLRGRYPRCTFEHLTVAGPDYTTQFVAQMVGRQIRQLEPDAYLVLMGSVEHLIRERDQLVEASQRYTVERDFLARHSVLLTRFMRSFHLERETRRLNRDAKALSLADSKFPAAYEAMMRPLADALGDSTVVALGYRGQLHPDMQGDALAETTRRMRTLTRGLTAEDFQTLHQYVVKALRGFSVGAGWMFIDPIGSLPRDADNFADPSHLTAGGIERIAPQIATGLALALREKIDQCR